VLFIIFYGSFLVFYNSSPYIFPGGETMRTKHVVYAAVFLCMMILLSTLTGCIATSSFPLRAKPGETIALTIGRTADEQGQGVTKNNLIVRIKDSGGVLVKEITGTSSGGSAGKIQIVFRSFPDPLSSASYDNPWVGFSGQIGALIDLPDDLATGSYTLSWEAAGTLPKYVGYWFPLPGFFNNYPIPLEILSGGKGSPHVFSEVTGMGGQLSDLEPKPRIQFTLQTGRADIGGLAVRFNLKPATFFKDPDPASSGCGLDANSLGATKTVQKYKDHGPYLSQNQVFDGSSPFTHQTMIQLIKETGGTKATFQFYIVFPNTGYCTLNPSDIDMSGIGGFTMSDPTINLGQLDSSHFAVYDLNGNAISGPTMNVRYFSGP